MGRLRAPASESGAAWGRGVILPRGPPLAPRLSGGGGGGGSADSPAPPPCLPAFVETTFARPPAKPLGLAPAPARPPWIAIKRVRQPASRRRGARDIGRKEERGDDETPIALAPPTRRSRSTPASTLHPSLSLPRKKNKHHQQQQSPTASSTRARAGARSAGRAATTTRTARRCRRRRPPRAALLAARPDRCR